MGSAVIGVGANPTAISLYNTGFVLGPAPDPDNCDKVTDKYTGTTRAVVANSGSNTISVLDIVNNVPLYTITVGNRPVALAVTTNGILSATAYVANYADSTVSQVDLKAGTTTATIPVGGQPNSVALTSGGVLWVGGGGFLTQINTANRTVVGTESAPGKSIIALGFSNSLNELIATSVDSAGSVYEDELAPGSFQAGAAYAPAASHSVSTMGTYTRQPSGQLVRAFTSTLVNNTSLSSFQVGAPPLVVQDGWAVVTATPTGFSITDASGHVVLVSEKTPSPVTAIAVDGGLKVAYLTLPDSNTLLTVPLPGVN